MSAMEDHAPIPPNLDTLPGVLFSEIVRRLRRNQWPAIPQVCRELRRMYNSSEHLWSSVHINYGPRGDVAEDEALEQLLAFLRPKGPCIRSFDLGTRLVETLDASKLARVLDCLAAPTLEALSISFKPCSHPEQLRVIGRLSSLTHLRLTSIPCWPLPANFAWLRQLQRLRDLNLDRLSLTPAAVQSIGCLPALTALRLTVRCGSPAAAAGLHAVLASLTGLQRLGLLSESLDLDAASCLSGAAGLSCLELRGETLDDVNPGARLAVSGLSALSGLQRLELEAGRFEAQDLYSCSGLTWLSLGGRQLSALRHSPPPRGALHQLHTLVCIIPDEQGWQFPVSVCQLTSIRHLDVWSARSLGDQPPELLLPEQFSQLQELRTLSIQFLSLPWVPPCIARLAKLEALRMGHTGLQLMMDGAYLDNLQVVSLQGNKLIGIPKVLRRAIKLTALDVSWNADLELDPWGIPRLLSSLTALRDLYIHKDNWNSNWTQQSVECLMLMLRRYPQVNITMDPVPPQFFPPA